MTEILAPISPGELIDKLTILRLKSENITQKNKRANVAHEQDRLQSIAKAALPESPALRMLWHSLYEINANLWAIEDDIRACDSLGDFGPEFVALARAVYVSNDERAAIKREINVLLGSAIIEEKSYFSKGANE